LTEFKTGYNIQLWLRNCHRTGDANSASYNTSRSRQCCCKGYLAENKLAAEKYHITYVSLRLWEHDVERFILNYV